MIDAVGTQNDAERLAETRRDLVDAAELRHLARHKQAVAIIDTAPPIKFSYPPFIQAAPEALSLPLYKGTPHIINLKSCTEDKKARRRTAKGRDKSFCDRWFFEQLASRHHEQRVIADSFTAGGATASATERTRT